MGFKVRLLPAAIQDIQVAYDWYEERLTGLGDRFISAVEDCFEDLLLNPFYQVRYENIRCIKINTFPYMVHFNVDEVRNIIFVSAILNTAMSNEHRRKI